MRKTMLAAMTAAVVLGMCVPAAAATYTAPNGILSIDLPGDNWQEMIDPSKWIALSDGVNVITIDHYSNGEDLPEITLADDHYVNVFQGIFSTQNEVFMITGSVADASKIAEITSAIASVKVLQYDTKLKINKTAAPSVSEFSVTPLDKTMYVISDGLNVRTGCSTNDQIIGGLSYGAAVKVTGSVQRNGQDLGWYVIAYENGTGYVSAGFLSDQQPAKKEGTTAGSETRKLTGKVKTIYAMSGTALSIYEASDGNWYDSNGQLFKWIADDRLESEGGEAFTTYPNSGESFFTGNSMTVYGMSGSALRIRESSDGYWYTDSGVRVSWIADDRLESEGGEAFTTYQVTGDFFTGNSTTVYALSGTAVTIRESSDGYWYTDSGTRVYWIDSERLESEGGDAFTTYYPDTTNDAVDSYDSDITNDAVDSYDLEDDNDYSDQEQVYCEYCGEWYPAGNEFRNHVCPNRDAALAAEAEEAEED